jgi:lipoprotein-anchoring transpeptidase ErfK/SrfK
MRNEDVIELFDLVREGMFVNIIEPGTIRSGEKE